MGKVFLLCTLLILALPRVKAQDDYINFSKPETWLMGYFDQDILLEEPHSKWFNAGFDDYSIDSDAFMKLTEIDIQDIEVLIVLGTWCPDSRREVPRFLKIAQLIGINDESLSMLGTDNYKRAPIDNYDDLNIERVPTFIFYRNKKELGRIIEYPRSSLEKDMLEILGVKN